MNLYGADLPPGGEDVTFVMTTVPRGRGINDIDALVHALDQDCLQGDVAGKGLCRSLRAKLDAAQAAADRERFNAAKQQLRAFIAELGVQRDKKVTESAFQRLVAMAEAVIAVLRW